jgi:Putative Flp pilus-assembly TadE/G-like
MSTCREPRSRRGAVSVMVAVMAPSLIAVAALVLDGGVWLIERARLQIAADAAANGAGYLLLDSSLQTQSSSSQTAAFQSVALAEANGAAAALIGTLVTPIAVSVASSWTSVGVTLTSRADSFLAEAIGLSGPTLVATASAGLTPAAACVLALNTSAADAIDVNNMGSIRATGCGIVADSTSSSAIYLNSGTISGQTIAAVGGFSESNSGSNTVSPASPTSGASPVANPYASLSPPVAGACDYTNASFTAWQSGPYSFTQSKNVFCGNTTIGGNSTTDTFAPGVYYVVNGNLVFNNADVTQAQGVTFVLSGSSPGSFQWTNYSGSYQMSAPTSGATAGILVWQECPSSGSAPANSMAGGSTLQISGSFYAPCGALQISNNAQLTTASGGSMSVIVNTISAVGSAGISAASSTGGSGGATRPHLTQ